jgi:hypothetical protein
MFIEWDVFGFSFLEMFLFLSFLLSGCYSLPDYRFCSGPYGPDKAQQLSGYCCDNLPLVFAGCTQFHIALMQPVLCFPRNLLGLF